MLGPRRQELISVGAHPLPLRPSRSAGSLNRRTYGCDPSPSWHLIRQGSAPPKPRERTQRKGYSGDRGVTTASRPQSRPKPMLATGLSRDKPGPMPFELCFGAGGGRSSTAPRQRSDAYTAELVRAQSVASLASLSHPVAPHFLSHQVGPILDAGGSWRHTEARTTTLRSGGVAERNLLWQSDLLGNSLRTPDASTRGSRTMLRRPRSAAAACLRATSEESCSSSRSSTPRLFGSGFLNGPHVMGSTASGRADLER